MIKNRNFEDLKIGDVVAACGGRRNDVFLLLEVTKVTKATFTAGKFIFNKSSGRLRGGSKQWDCPFAWIPAEKEKQEIQKDTKTRKLKQRARFLLQQTVDIVNQLSDDELASLIQKLHPYLDKRKAE